LEKKAGDEKDYQQTVFDRIFQKDFSVYFSEISETELSLPKDCYNHLDLDNESKELAEAYLEEKILGKASLNDAYHIAIATVNRLDVLISWNFKHIVNYDKIKLFNSINLRLGYPMIEIRSPKDFLKFENND
jgi:hypothetical protein